jgi:hypothetical protein
VCHESGGGVQREFSPGRRFLSAPYVADGSERARPVEGIDQCPWAEGSEGCRIRGHHWRERKTGPSVALRVLKCLTHGQAFTVYPPGFVPYGRQPWIRLDLRGCEVKRLEGEDHSFEGCEFRGFGGREEGKSLVERAGWRSSARERGDPEAEDRTSRDSTGTIGGGFLDAGRKHSGNSRPSRPRAWKGAPRLPFDTEAWEAR